MRGEYSVEYICTHTHQPAALNLPVPDSPLPWKRSNTPDHRRAKINRRVMPNKGDGEDAIHEKKRHPLLFSSWCRPRKVMQQLFSTGKQKYPATTLAGRHQQAGPPTACDLFFDQNHPSRALTTLGGVVCERIHPRDRWNILNQPARLML